MTTVPGPPPADSALPARPLPRFGRPRRSGGADGSAVSSAAASTRSAAACRPGAEGAGHGEGAVPESVGGSRRGPYLWEHPAWPDGLAWSAGLVTAALTAAHHAQGRLLAKASLVGMADRAALEAAAYEDEALRTVQIEGERLDRDSVRSSVARQLGLDRAGAAPSARNVDDLFAVLLDATRNAAAPVTLERLCGWQPALFPTGFSGPHRPAVGAIRTAARPSGAGDGGAAGAAVGRGRADPAEPGSAPPLAQLVRMEPLLSPLRRVRHVGRGRERPRTLGAEQDAGAESIPDPLDDVPVADQL